ncbi:glycosyltransferase family 1 protein [Sphingomonas sp. BK345]|uniref:glycosyltransferase family 4 protein n=1 Tax=Sphingomonas sp. BK345 TaxID=2586980 RepID=UPI001611ED5C|nr:glycosyltransferase [Sphingomonas sp. BK345]MBB3475460.1 glycosyltransferase involved in cell wall biosynthesis [Sphingomonas sp. BK345]
MRPIRHWWETVAARWPLRARSNGVPVGRATARDIRAGNAARSRQDWAGAATAYRRALTREPGLHHIWVQLGHMQKEAGQIDAAGEAYETAARLHPDDAEPLLRLGHMAKAWRQPADAAGHFVAALRRDPANLQAVAELVRLMPDRERVAPALWDAVLEVLHIDPAEAAAAEPAQLPAGSTVFDVTDLLAFFGQRRLPTGIQRVQIEVSLACLEGATEPRPIFCLYASARRGWIRLPPDRFERLCRLARQSDDVTDPAWTRELDLLYRRVAVARTVRFAPATVLVNLGTSWADRNYLLDVRVARARDAMVYVPLIFDLIPLIEPRWFVRSLVRDYRAWFGSLLHSADGVLAISEATRRDLLRVSAEWQAPVPGDAVPVVRLDGDFRQDAADARAVREYGLEPGGYVLLVSTLEPRKNHLGAFRAWLALAQRLGEAAVPRLVCVGGRGWLNEELHQFRRDHPALGRLVIILHGVPDDTLAALYEHCLFALYPSFYEGWGLPVSEALSYGKVPAISRVSSLPEAGGRFARYFDPAAPADIAAAALALLDTPTRHAAEQAIRADYAPRSWRRIAHDLVDQAAHVGARDALPRLAAAGTWSLALAPWEERGEIAATEALGEALRHGHGWRAPGRDGCAIEGDDAALRFHWVGAAGHELRVHVAAAHDPVSVRIGSAGVARDHHAAPGTPLTLACALPAAAVAVEVALVPLAGEVTVTRVEVARAAA